MPLWRLAPHPLDKAAEFCTEGPSIILLWQGRGAEAEYLPVGVHFDALVVLHGLMNLPWRDLQQQVQTLGRKAPRHWRRLHMAHALRGDPTLKLAAKTRLRAPTVPHGLRVLQWNVLSVKVCKTEVEEYLQHLSPHVICLQETWHKDAHDLPVLPGFSLTCETHWSRQRRGDGHLHC